MKYILLVFCLSFLFSNCDLQSNNCGKYNQECTEYYKNFASSLDDLIPAQEEYAIAQRQFLLDITYNKEAQDKLIETEKPLNECLADAPLGDNNAAFAKEFYRKKSSSGLREIHETNRYFLDVFAKHYTAATNCYKEAQPKLNALIAEYTGKENNN